MDAETTYFFRHALVRDAAYELQIPGDRARLHKLALASIEHICGGGPPADETPWQPKPTPHPTDRFLPALVEHSSLAPDTLETRQRGALYIYRAAAQEVVGYRMQAALALLRRLVNHPGANDYLRARAHFHVGEILYRLGDLVGSKREYGNSEKYVDATRDEVAMTILRSCHTVVDSHSDNGPHVAQAHKEAADFWRARGDVSKLLGSLINFAVWHCEEGDQKLARETLLEVTELGRRHDVPLAMSSGHGLIALLDDNQNRPDLAEAGLREAIRLAREAGDPLRETTWLTNLGAVYREASRFDEAEECLSLAGAICDRYALETRGNFADGNRAGIMVQRGKPEAGRELWNRAWKRAIKRDDPYERKVLRSMMDDALKRAGQDPLPRDGFLR